MDNCKYRCDDPVGIQSLVDLFAQDGNDLTSGSDDIECLGLRLLRGDRVVNEVDGAIKNLLRLRDDICLTVDDVRCTQRLQVLRVMKRRSRNDRRKPGELQELKSYDATRT